MNTDSTDTYTSSGRKIKLKRFLKKYRNTIVGSNGCIFTEATSFVAELLVLHRSQNGERIHIAEHSCFELSSLVKGRYGGRNCRMVHEHAFASRIEASSSITSVSGERTCLANNYVSCDVFVHKRSNKTPTSVEKMRRKYSPANDTDSVYQSPTFPTEATLIEEIVLRRSSVQYYTETSLAPIAQRSNEFTLRPECKHVVCHEGLHPGTMCIAL